MLDIPIDNFSHRRNFQPQIAENKVFSNKYIGAERPVNFAKNVPCLVC